MATYPVTEQTKAGRYAERASYDKTLVHSILSSSPIAHVAFNAPSSTSTGTATHPSVLPMLAALSPSPHDPTSSVIYLHGSSHLRLATLCDPTPSNPDGGLPVTLSTTLLDGYVLALSPFSHSVNYRSVIVYGRAHLVTSPDEIMVAMESITNRLVPDRWDNSRVPPTPSEIKQTGILRVEIEGASAKVRAGGPHSDRRDLKNEETVGRVWTGVVPVWEEMGHPVDGSENGAGDAPGYVKGWVRGENAKRRGYAEENAVDQ
ncbi:hypothetical protein CAC42_3950 [Sphaceloma murrayae]|uniref:Flavin-nucleotide-binding protein n=1 Tax=Sphaceloma murrayae TaxID=2082308 RepID=A0A2K1QSH3_9PEZI|nr:hypothetical protein CAC42_3950 [Sphaceloma murrayae]